MGEEREEKSEDGETEREKEQGEEDDEEAGAVGGLRGGGSGQKQESFWRGSWGVEGVFGSWIWVQLRGDSGVVQHFTSSGIVLFHVSEIHG